MAHLVEQPTVDFSSGHDLTVCEFKPCTGLCDDVAEPAWYFLSPPLTLTLPGSHKHAIFFFLKNKRKQEEELR